LAGLLVDGSGDQGAEFAHAPAESIDVKVKSVPRGFTLWKMPAAPR
jgi:hypothetical protein